MPVDNTRGTVKIVTTAFFATILIVASLSIVLPIQQGPIHFEYPPPGKLYQFKSIQHILDYFDTHYAEDYIWYYSGEIESSASLAGLGYGVANQPPPHSETNVQVEGVDEPDLVKTDGLNIYSISNDAVFVVQAYPSESAQIINEINPIGTPQAIFLYESSRLVILSRVNWGNQTIEIFDVSNPNNVVRTRLITYNGYYRSARLIGQYLYFVGYSYPIDENDTFHLPEFIIDYESMIILPWNIYYDPGIYDRIFYYNSILGLDVTDSDANPNVETILAGQRAGVIYTSLTNLYIASAHYPWFGWWTDRKTAIHRFTIAEGRAEYVASGEVPGYLINQFALDEFDNHLRVATTAWLNMSNPYGWDIQQVSNVYVLNMTMSRVGHLEGLAPDEMIYSVRFIGPTGYLVTFELTDPLFVIDLTQATNPQLLGELHIPGYSNYLHPLGNNQLLGLGKNVTIAGSGSWWWYTGMKISLFNATDPSDPQETANMIIGVRGTTSPALYDHHAVLCDPEMNLLVIPIYLREYTSGPPDSTSQLGDFIWAGVYVFYINPDNATITVRGQLSDITNPSVYNLYESWYLDWIGVWNWYPTTPFVYRSLYIGDVLYTISFFTISMYDLNDLSHLGTISLQG